MGIPPVSEDQEISGTLQGVINDLEKLKERLNLAWKEVQANGIGKPPAAPGGERGHLLIKTFNAATSTITLFREELVPEWMELISARIERGELTAPALSSPEEPTLSAAELGELMDDARALSATEKRSLRVELTYFDPDAGIYIGGATYETEHPGIATIRAEVSKWNNHGMLPDLPAGREKVVVLCVVPEHPFSEPHLIFPERRTY